MRIEEPLLNFEYPRPGSIRNYLSFLRRGVVDNWYNWSADWKIRQIVKKGECAFGPFIGELGHLLAHNLPLVAWLAEQGVKIHFVGFQKFEPFLYNQFKEPLYEEFYALRDFSHQMRISANFVADLPEDVRATWNNYKSLFLKKGMPKWYLEDDERNRSQA